MRGTSGRSIARHLGAGALALALLGALPAGAQEYDFTMGVITSPGDVYTALTQSIPERISQATDGRVAITVSDSLVAPGQIASAVRDGRLPMSAALHTYLAAEEPRMGIFNLPGLIDDIILTGTRRVRAIVQQTVAGMRERMGFTEVYDAMVRRAGAR